MKKELKEIQKADKLEKAMLDNFEQVHPDVVHRFTPGMYIREILIKAGTLLTSMTHKTEHPFVISYGIIKVEDEDGTVHEYQAPYTGITTPGRRRILYAVTDTIWTTFHATEETDLDVLCADVWGPYGNALVTGCNDPLALNYDPCVNTSCNMSLTDTSCCEYPSCEDLATQPEHLGCCAKCDSPDFNPEEDPTCAPHCECCEDNYMRYTCSQGTCLSGPNSDYPFETLEECENSGCGEPGGVTDYTGPVFPTMGGTPNTGTPIKDPGKAPFKDKSKRASSNKVINRLKELAGIKKPKK